MALRRRALGVPAVGLGGVETDVGDVVGIPSFREHGDGYDATDAGTELAGLAHGVHDLAEELAAALGNLDALAQFEGVVVGDDDLGAVDLVEHVVGHQLAVLVIAVRIVRLEHLEAVLDSEARGDNEESAGEGLAAGTAHGLDRLPGDEHGHDGGLARTGGELEREAHEVGVGLLVDAGQERENAFSGDGLGSHLGEPDGGFHRLHLTEERAGQESRF